MEAPERVGNQQDLNQLRRLVAMNYPDTPSALGFQF
jgi:hypothetical protein